MFLCCPSFVADRSSLIARWVYVGGMRVERCPKRISLCSNSETVPYFSICIAIDFWPRVVDFLISQDVCDLSFFSVEKFKF